MLANFDPDKLDKILYNLLSNAFKFTPSSGNISVGLSVGEETLAEEKSDIRIVVKDSGIGIEKELLPKIFDRFYQVENKFNNYGTGIGLALVKELVKIHNGEIKVQSEPGKGSEFEVTLPIFHPNESVQQDDRYFDFAEGLDENKKKTVEKKNQMAKFPLLLLIEDNSDMRLFIMNEFIDNYRIIQASEGNEGLHLALEEIPDAIICDVMLPGLDGFEICRTLKSDERTSHIPILMLTAKSSEENILEGFKSGADDYITKPFSPEVLKARIKNMLDSRIALRKKFIKEPFASIKDFSPSGIDEKLLNKAYAIVEKNLNNQNFKALDFANEIGMSRAQLYRKIQAVSGQSVKEFVRTIRLKKAAELLVTSHDNISEVSFNVGFSSTTYFSKSFGEYFGMTPSKYIAQHKK
jgi:DNA-binding response OmpR family regulator